VEGNPSIFILGGARKLMTHFVVKSVSTFWLRLRCAVSFVVSSPPHNTQKNLS
jgi:hypothetical protein